MTTVVVKSVDEGLVRRGMDAYAHRLLASFGEIDEIIVFGSFETGKYVPGSDLDVLIVLSQSTLSIRDRIPVYMPDHFPVPVDLFPFTRAELSERARSPIIKAADASSWRYARS